MKELCATCKKKAPYFLLTRIEDLQTLMLCVGCLQQVVCGIDPREKGVG
jgi:hypothetical protein